eukprot:Amastigsp_a843345_80.p1 type:complete len:201 gc:universal Amastigsp_a843345_80:128-730(+)
MKRHEESSGRTDAMTQNAKLKPGAKSPTGLSSWWLDLPKTIDAYRSHESPTAPDAATAASTTTYLSILPADMWRESGNAQSVAPREHTSPTRRKVNVALPPELTLPPCSCSMVKYIEFGVAFLPLWMIVQPLPPSAEPCGKHAHSNPTFACTSPCGVGSTAQLMVPIAINAKRNENSMTKAPTSAAHEKLIRYVQRRFRK